MNAGCDIGKKAKPILNGPLVKRKKKNGGTTDKIDITCLMIRE